MALALALLFASTLALTAADRTVNGVLGFDKHNVLVAQLNLPERDLRRRREAAAVHRPSVMDAMRAIPAVIGHRRHQHHPRRRSTTAAGRFFPEGEDLHGARGALRSITGSADSGYFAAMKIPLHARPLVRRHRSPR